MAQPTQLDQIAQAMSQLPPPDPRDDPARVDTAMYVQMKANQGHPVSSSEVPAILQAHRELYGLGALQGNLQEEALEAQHGQQSFLQNAIPAANAGIAKLWTTPLSAVDAPEAEREQYNAAHALGTPAPGSGGQLAGMALGDVVGALPMVAGEPNPALLGTYFATQGVGAARQEVRQQREAGANISGLSEAEYAVASGAIQGLLANFLGSMGVGGVKILADGDLTETVPLQTMIRRLSPSMLESIQGTDGAVIRPIIQRTLLSMGVGAAQNEVANVAQNIAANITNVSKRGLLSGSGAALLQGAAYGAVGQIGHEGQSQSFGPAEQIPQENILNQGTVGSGSDAIPRQVRYASETPFDEEPPITPASSITPSPSSIATAENAPIGPPQEPGTPAEPGIPAEPATPEGRPLPAGHPLAPQADELDQMQAKADELLSRAGGGATEPLQGRLPDNTDLTTGERPSPLVEAAQVRDPSLQVAPRVTPEFQEAADAFTQARGVKVIPIQSDTMDGFSHPDHPDSILVNVDRPEQGFQQAIAHEWAHTFMDQNPEAAQEVLKAVPKARRAQMLDEYAAQYGPGSTEYLAKNGDQEVFAGIIQKAVGDGESGWNALLRKNPTLWEKIKSVGSTILNSFTANGRLLNKARNVLADNTDIQLQPPLGQTNIREAQPAMTSETPPEGNALPRKTYLNVGHKPGHDEELWWTDEDGNIVKRHGPVHAGTEGEFAPFRGRIDHTAKEVSIAASSDNDQGPMADRRIEYQAKRLQDEYPDYKVYVPGKGGIVPLEEMESGGRFMLSKLKKMGSIENNKDELNKETPEDEAKWLTAVLDKVPVPIAKVIRELKPNNLQRKFFDDEWPVIKYIRGMAGKLNDPSQLSPEAYVRRMGGFRERYFQEGKHGYSTLGGQFIIDRKTGENLSNAYVFRPVMEAAGKLGERWQDVADHAVSIMGAQRTLEKAAIRQSRGESMEQPISGIGEARAAAADEPHTGLHDVAEAQDYLKSVQDEPGYEESLEFARRLRLLGNEHMRMAVEGGIISKEQAKAMLDNNKFYVNMQRVMRKEGALQTGDFVGPYRVFRGSNRDTDNPVANTLQSLEQIAKKAELNFTKQKILELAAQVGEPLKNIPEPTTTSISVMDNGELKHYETTPLVAEVINGWSNFVPPPVWAALSNFPGKLRALGTLVRPMFMWNHFRKQVQNRLATSEYAGGISGIGRTFQMFDPEMKELMGTLGGTLGKERDYGTSSTDYLNLISKAMDKGKNSNTLFALASKAWDGYKNIMEWSDAPNRIAEFKGAFAAAKRQGMSDLDAQNFAAWKARDLMNFSQAGTLVKQLNRFMYVPFLNAEMQGLNRMIQQVRMNPSVILPRLAIFGLMPTLVPYLWAKSQGPEVEKRYMDRPLAQRIMFYSFPVGNYDILFPKGQTQAMLSAPWEAMVDKHRGNISTWVKAMGDSGLIPRPLVDPESILPFQGLRDSISNFSWFYDRHIVPPDQEGTALDIRHTDGASGLAKQISQVAQKHAGWEIDPRYIDHTLATDLGTSGIDVESASNLGQPNKPLAGKMAALFYGDVRLPPGYTAESVQDAMSGAQRYKDEGSPQLKAVEDPLHQSYSATTVEARNDLVNQATAAADAANQFYADHGDQLLAAKVAQQQIAAATAAIAQHKADGTLRTWVTANQAQLRLAGIVPDIHILQTRILAARKALANPGLSPAIRDAANKSLTTAYGLIVTLVQNAQTGKRISPAAGDTANSL